MRFREFHPPSGTVADAWGHLAVERRRYAPLEPVRVMLGPAETGASAYRVEWFDGLGRRYGWAEGAFGDGPAAVRFLAGGAPGMQFVRLWLDGAERPCRLVNFTVAAETALHTGDGDLDALYPLTREAMLLNRRRYLLDGRPVVGYTTADSVQTLAYWLRDMLYNLPGYMLWEDDVTSGYAALFARQQPDGSLPDGVRADGSTWRMITESDVEYLAVIALWRTWLVSGDDDWLIAWLPVATRALEQLKSSPLRWSPERRLVLRAHTCDTWDFSIYEGDRYDEATPKVAALCDQTGYYQALIGLAQVHHYLGERRLGLLAAEEAANFRLAAATALWDGTKFRHHLHLDAFDHGAFDEERQLAMSNPWAVTRGFATAEQARRIVATYRERQRETGEPPWWSLQPGYPHQDYPFLDRHSYQHTGGYCNGGLMPWVGGALATAALVSGEEPYGVELLRDYAAFLRERGGEVYTWYWPNGEPGFRTANTTGHDGWGMGHWLQALFEGLAGVAVTGPAMRSVSLSPRWAATDLSEVGCTVHLPSSEAYLAYRWRREQRCLRLTVTGSAEQVTVRLLLPELARTPVTARLYDTPVKLVEEQVGLSRYVTLELPAGGVQELSVAW